MQFNRRQIPAGNPLANALVVVIGALAIGASLVLGVVALVVLGSIVLILGAIVGIRVWWFNRRLARSSRTQRSETRQQRVDIIEGEYRIISGERKEPGKSPE
jgi:Flp pilus assembly protein TadB